jgi:peptidyl-prolyl isomerase E (cyclophilin E)
MEEGNKTKKTVFVGGVGEDVNEEIILEKFSVFGVPFFQSCVLRG